jgi:apolipoprotein N-acyltransferase
MTFLLAPLSGLLLFASDHPLGFLPLQLVAWVPLLLALERTTSWWRAAACGFLAGLGCTLPLLVVLRFPLLLGGGLALYLSLLSAIFAILARFAQRRGGAIGGALAIGAAAVLVSWMDSQLVPVWGTAQSFVRPWSRAPWSVQFVAVTGMTGLVFVLVASQALAISLARTRRRGVAIALAVVLAVPAALDVVCWTRPFDGAVRVAAMGWRTDEVEAGLYDSLLAEAAEGGARLVVSPETGFLVPTGVWPVRLARLGVLARQHGVVLAFGFFDEARNDNRVALVDEAGAPRGEYVKTHLIPAMESYRAGDGTLLVADLAGVRTGTMICQDDNFTDLARGYGRAGVEILLVPTNDWREVAPYHLDSTRFRAIETGAALVRATSNGISALVSPRGELLAARDHLAAGAGLLVADVPVRRLRTPYAFAGDWPMVALALGLLAPLARRREC